MSTPTRKRISMIGPIMPPAGGVSVHIERLTHLLTNDFDVQLIDESRVKKPGILNIRNFNFFGYLKALAKSDIVHIHSGTRSLKYAHILISRLMGKKTVLTIHFLKNCDTQLKVKMDGWMYSLPHLTIPVAKDITERIALTNNAVVKDAFLPPVLETEPPIPEELVNWMASKKAAGYQIAVANAWRLDHYKGKDRYGLDICIAAFDRLKKEGKKVCLVYVVSDLGGEIDIKIYEDQITTLGLTEVLYLRKKQVSFVNLVRQADVVLRPTNADGDALTVREALILGKSVIASDAVPRPAGSIIFKNRDADSLAEMISGYLAGQNREVRANAGAVADYGKFYKEVYSNLS